MFSFLILLPLTLISVAIGFVLVTTPQVAEYVEYLSKLSLHQEAGRLRLQIAAHVLTYGLMCFVLAATARTVSAPLSPDRRAILKYLQLILEGIFVSVPSVVLIVLAVKALKSDWSNWILWLGVGMATAGLIATLLATLTRRPCDFFRSTFRPFHVTKTDLLGGIALGAGVALFVSFLFQPVESATFLGLFPVLFIAFTTAHLVVAAIFTRGASPIAILSTIVSVVVVLQFIDSSLTTREFRHSSVLNKFAPDIKREELLRQREILYPLPAFERWLEHRRPAIEAYRNKGKKYPVFIVAAQGGGIYAGYHSALTLARLYDACPEFSHHLFAISGVSGGALGAAVFSELLRTVPAGPANDPQSPTVGCSALAREAALEPKVQTFFSANFLSPVVASAFVFDLPGLLIPQMRFGLDRAEALEYAFEAAWRKASPVAGKEPVGLDKDFYGRWKPEGLPPALILATTGVNHGVPVLVSQINWGQGMHGRGAGRDIALLAHQASRNAVEQGKPLPEVFKFLKEVFEQRDGSSRVAAVGNILDFRPDLQLATSTAVLLSARFPYVTPPANIRQNKKLNGRSDLFGKTEVLELMDGGMFDNSGGRVAVDFIYGLELSMSVLKNYHAVFKEFYNDITFHLIQFTDTDAQRHGGASERGHFELATPLVAFNNVRLTRGADLADMRHLNKTRRHLMYLADEWFQPHLNWLLTEPIKHGIELRSGGKREAANDLCCRIVWTDTTGKAVLDERIKIDPDREHKLREYAKVENLKIERFAPDDSPFRTLIELVGKGDDQAPPVAAH